MFNKVSQTYNRQSSAVQLALNGSAIIILFLLWKTSLLTITVPVQGIVHYLFPITSLGRNGLVCGAGCWKKKRRFDPLCWGTARQKKEKKNTGWETDQQLGERSSMQPQHFQVDYLETPFLFPVFNLRATGSVTAAVFTCHFVSCNGCRLPSHAGRGKKSSDYQPVS